MWLLLLICVALLLCWVYVKWMGVRNYWKIRGVPFSSPNPILGSLTFLLRKNAAIWMKDLYFQTKGPYVGIWLFWKPALVIKSNEISHRILVKDFDNFRNRLSGTGAAATDSIGGLNLFTVDDPIWTTMRRRLTPVFTSAKLKGLHHLFVTKSKELVQRIKNDLRNNKRVDIQTLYSDYTTDVIGIAAFGVASDATLTSDSAMRAVTKQFMHFSVYRGLSWCSIFFFPELVNIFRFKFFPNESVEYFKKVFRQIVTQRGGYSPEGKDNDLLDALRKIKYEADVNGEDMDEELLVSQAAIFLQGGFETSATNLSYLTYELAYNQDIQEKLYQELKEAKEMLNGEDFDGAVLRELVYLNCVIKETLRMYAPLGWLDRRALSSYRIDDNLTIPAGTTVFINTIGLHYDPKYYPEPTQFRPERFLAETPDSTSPFLPFGDGPRHCIGMRFAYHTIWHAVAELVLNFKIDPLPGEKKPSECEVETHGLLYRCGHGQFVNFIPRENVI